MKARGPYKARDVETRGEYPKEARIFRSFWSKHKMKDIEFLTPEELDIVINKFFEEYEARQIKVNYLWWYPDSPMDRVVDLRYRK